MTDSNTENMSGSEKYEDVSLDSIFCDHEFNSRSYITPASVGTLAQDIEHNGLFQAIVLQPYSDEANPTLKWKIVMGHRRFLATCMVCKRRPDLPKTIKAKIGPAMADDRALVLNLKENLEREPLDMLQEARALGRFSHMGWDVARIARELSRPPQWVKVRLALLTLPEVIQNRAAAGWITQYDVETLSEMSTDEERFTRVRELVDHKLKRDKLSKMKKPVRPVHRKAILAAGEPRPLRVILAYLDWIQDGFSDIRHPAAMALSFAAGVIDEQQFRAHVQDWADAADIDLPMPDISEDDRRIA